MVRRSKESSKLPRNARSGDTVSGRPTSSVDLVLVGHTGTVDRVVVLGRGGAGKSVLASALGASIGAEVIELDKVYWSESLEPLTTSEWAGRQTVLAERQRWVMDGDLGPYDFLEPRLGRADTVVVLDLPLWLCAWRAWRRGPRRRDFWVWTARWRQRSRPHLLQAVVDVAPDAELVVLSDRRAVDRWLSGVDS
jgi:hypothetical protein